ncbi:MAG TPA: hypothetical protein VLM79_24500 [Kofleriaceae bacterium]|nr:hypothetical protein [Kofleriaceae bacterium]
MTRIAPSPMPGLEGDRHARIDRCDGAELDRTERTPASAPGTPFRAALRKADKMARPVDDAPPAQPPAPLPPQTQPGSIADVIASSTDGTIAAPGIQAVRAPSVAAVPDATIPNATMPSATMPSATRPVATAQEQTAQDAPTEGATAQRTPAKVSDSPVTAWVAAAVARAVGSFASADGAQPANPMNAAGAANSATAMPAASLAATGLDSALPALSPLEQAVHDLIGRATQRDDKDPRERAPVAAPDVAAISLQVVSAPTATDAAPRSHAPAMVHAAQAAQLPELPTNPSHVHLVLDDGPERTVVTVAVRGSEVHVALRSSDDDTGAALARNAASLDHAMRARGLQLGELTAEREPRDPRQPRDPEPRERRDPKAERFKLEEKP